MAKPLYISIKESEKELRVLLKKQPEHLRNRVRMLLELKINGPAGKNDLARIIGVNHNSIQSWRSRYLHGGLKTLLKFKRGGFTPTYFDKKITKEIEKKLNNPSSGFRSYEELRSWIDKEFIPGIGYQTVNKFVKRKFGAKLKVARKSHINKDEKAVKAFKKNSH